jgi:hypothetical protein
MPDVWELGHGLATHSAADALLDSDKDGMSNLSEFLTGTDPLDPHRLMKVEKLTPPSATSNLILITFMALTGRSYAVQHPFSLNSNSWQTFTTIPPMTADHPVIVQNPSTLLQTARFYRFRTPAP